MLVWSRWYLSSALLVFLIGPFLVRASTAILQSGSSSSSSSRSSSSNGSEDIQDVTLTSAVAAATTNASAPSHYDLQTSSIDDQTSQPPLHALSLTDLINSWDLVLTNWQSFTSSTSSSAAAANALTNMYDSIRTFVLRNSDEFSLAPSKTFTFTYRRLQCSIRSTERAIPWGVVGGIARVMMGLTRAGMVGLYTIVFYFLKGSAIWSVVVVVLTLVGNQELGVLQNIIP